MRRCFYFLIVSFLFVPNVTYASFNIRADVNSSSVIWDNVTQSYGKMVPSEWGTPPSIQSVAAWSAATFAATPANTMILWGGGGQSNPIPINVSGVQYNTSGIEYALDIGGNSLGGGCTLDEVTLPIITVEGSNCISTTKLINATNSSPFIFLRPMFGLDDDDVISALKGLPEGTYSASVPIIIRYYYENNSITTFRNINEVIIFSFKYSPVQLDSIDVIGDGVMIPLYDTTNRRVTSNTSFDINAFGYFDDGIILTLPNQEYELVNSSEPSVTIPYSINCVQCSSMNLVRDGILFNNDVSIGEGSGAQTNIGFSLEFDYDVNGENILSGEYFDEVTIILEPSI